MLNKKRVLAGLLSLTTLASVMPAAEIHASEYGDDVKNYLIVLREDVPLAAMYNTEGEVSNHNYMVVPMTEQEAAEILLDERIVSVEEDVIVTAMTEDDNTDEIVRLENLLQPSQEYEWNLTAIHATPEDLAMYPTDESQIRVAVLDSGTSVCEDLDVTEYLNLVDEEQDITTYDEDGTGHGTAVAGILAANDDQDGILGVAPDVDLYSVKVFDYSNAAPISRIIEGIYWAIDNDIHILNMSFGTNVNSYALHQAIQAADEAGILMVAAAGNSGVVEYPAAYPEVIAVGAVDYQGVRADFSATGAALELTAPGECVLTDSFYGGIMALNGTSLAAPHVAGAAALLWAKDTTKSSDFIRQLMNASANCSLGSTEEYGNGLLDVRRAFEIYDEFAANYVPGVSEYAGMDANMEEYTSGEISECVVGLWFPSKHGTTIDQGVGNYNSTQLAIMRATSAYMDNSKKYKSNWKQCYFHGGRNYNSYDSQSTNNYVNDLMFLYNVAMELKGMSNSTSVAAQEQVVQNVADQMTRENGIALNEVFVSRVKDLIEENVETTTNELINSGIQDQTTVTVNTYKILGAAMHLAGDIYAHRSIVPRNSIENGLFDESHFTHTTSVCTYAEIREKAYNAIVSETGKNTADMCPVGHSWQCFVIAVEDGMIEFKDIRRFANDTYAKIYEDNVNFYKSRYSVGTNYTTKYILDSFASGSELDGRLFLPGVYSGKSYAIRLNSLKRLYEELGFTWNSSWSAYTTSIVR